MLVIDIIYIFFITLSLYFTILFLLIFFDQRKNLLKDNLPTYWPKLTILIPIHNKAKDIAECIHLIKSSDYPKNKLSIIALNDKSTDNTLNILNKIKGIKIISNAKNIGKALTLNKAIKFVQSEFVAVIDGDSFIDKNALKLIVGKILENDNIGAVTCAITTKGTGSFLQRLQDIEYSIIVWVRKLLQTVDSIYVTPGPLALYRTKVLKEIGGFDSTNITEDIEIAWKLMYHGYKVRMALGAKVLVDSHKSFKKWWRQRQRWSMGGIQTLLKYKNTLFKKRYGMLGKFVGPFFLLSIFVSLSGFIVFSYTMGITLMKVIYSILAPNSVFQYYKDIIMLPSVFLYFGIIIFILSLAYVYFGLHTMNNKRYLSFRNLRIIDLLAYLTIYVTIFPVILLTAMYRLYRRDMSWY
jgi:poly-beta-1,6-N-acetyl-D-glucosamine synthase